MTVGDMPFTYDGIPPGAQRLGFTVGNVVTISMTAEPATDQKQPSKLDPQSGPSQQLAQEKSQSPSIIDRLRWTGFVGPTSKM